MATQAQIRANRENAKSSTGPKTAGGKLASSRNSTKHGGYATRDLAIPRGEFAEDPDEVEQYVDELAAALAPRDALERAEARNIALMYLRLRRVARFEADSIGGAGAPEPKVERAYSFPEELNDKVIIDETWRQAESALRVLERILATSSRIESRSANTLNQSYRRYQALQTRNLVAPNEPNPI